MSRRIGQSETKIVRASSRLLLGLVVVGSLCVLVSFGFTVSWVERTLSPDGWVSTILAHRIEWLQWGSFLIGAAGVMLAGAMTKRAWVFVAAVGLSLCAAAAFVNAFYPQHLLFTPRRLAGAVLGKELLLRDFAPESVLRVEAHDVLQARYPAINIHAHLHDTGVEPKRSAEELLRIMDACNVQAIVDLDGGVGDRLREEMAAFTAKSPERLLTFAHIWFGNVLTNWPYFYGTVNALDEASTLGVRGIKIWKNLGLVTRDQHNQVIGVDDPRLEPLWAKAETLHLPVLIHLSDPEAFFHPIDAKNERYDELTYFGAPSWAHPRYPRSAKIFAQFERVLDRHPTITFIGAHMLMLAHDLKTLGTLLDRHPNLSIDISAQAHELGREPVTARTFFLRYADHILFGTDGNSDEQVYRGYFRLLETADEYFKYPLWSKRNFGRWRIYGLDLPDNVLRKVYHDNAARILRLPLAGGQRD